MYSRNEIDFLNYLDTNQSEPTAKFLTDSEAMTPFERLRGQVIYFVRVVLALILVQIVARSVLSVVAIISKKTEIMQFDELGNATFVEVDKETWVAYQTYSILRNYFYILNY